MAKMQGLVEWRYRLFPNTRNLLAFLSFLRFDSLIECNGSFVVELHGIIFFVRR